jgi:hypothetical protein
MICQLCLQDKKLIRSHIIPASFFRLAYPEKNCRIVTKDEYSKRLLVGLYDMEIVCEECEKIFSRWDDYGNRFFSEILESGKNKIINKNNINIIIFDDIKYSELKLFLMSVLWRCAVSRHPFFNQISLGSFENQLKENILSSNPGSDEEFAILIFKFDVSKADILHPPRRMRLNGVNGYRLYFFNAEVFVKVDKRSSSKLASLILGKEKPLIVILKDPPQVIRLLNESRDKKA